MLQYNNINNISSHPKLYIHRRSCVKSTPISVGEDITNILVRITYQIFVVIFTSNIS